jgi:hypothetical protein
VSQLALRNASALLTAFLVWRLGTIKKPFKFVLFYQFAKAQTHRFAKAQTLDDQVFED